MNLFINYFLAADPARQTELDMCLGDNLRHPLIDRIIIILDEPAFKQLPVHKDYLDKVQFCKTPHRPTFNDFFRFTSLYEGDINIIANADIVFNDTLEKVQQYDWPADGKTCMALTRWDMQEKLISYDRVVKGKPIFFNRSDSQDCWIFKGKVQEVPEATFSMGRAGCDNKIAYLLEQAGYQLINPSRSIMALHRHGSQLRYYDIKQDHQDIKPPYRLLKPAEL